MIKQSQNDYLRDWLLQRAHYLQVLLAMEGQRGMGECNACGNVEGSFRCKDCFGGQSLCRVCMLSSHKCLPFHRLELWEGNCFSKTSLFEQGFILHLGHGGEICPQNQWRNNLWEDVTSSPDDTFDADEPIVEGEEALGNVLVIIDSAGVFQHRVVWCTCGGNIDQTMQLFQEQLFPATHRRPKSAFTFNVLDQFYIDAMECKTTAMSFFQKLRRLTDNAFPDKVHVRKISFVTSTFRLKSIYLRIATEN